MRAWIAVFFLGLAFGGTLSWTYLPRPAVVGDQPRPEPRWASGLDLAEIDLRLRDARLLVRARFENDPSFAAAPLAAPQPMVSDDRPRGLRAVAYAVEGAESSWGRDPAMWQPNPDGPQGLMQVSLAAAIDVGGGDRFDPVVNRDLGQAYLARMFHRFGNWPDAVTAYNWGPANLDRWIAAGRPQDGLSTAIRAYRDRVLSQAEQVQNAPPPAFASAVAPAPAPPPPAPPDDPRLRRVFLENAAMMERLRNFLGGPKTAEDAEAVVDLIRRVAARPRFAEFKAIAATKAPVPPDSPGLSVIIEVLLGKLKTENAALVMLDGRRRPPPASPTAIAAR